MSDKTMRIEIRQIPIEYFVDGEFSTPLYRLIDLLEELNDTDGYFTFINISSVNTQKYLIENGYASKSVRGSCYKPMKIGNKLQDFINKLQSLTLPQ